MNQTDIQNEIKKELKFSIDEIFDSKNSNRIKQLYFDLLKENIKTYLRN